MTQAAEPILLHAAGSLRASLDAVAAAYEKATGVKVIAKYGASGTLREEIERGAKAEVFASANMEHPLGPVDIYRSQIMAPTRNSMAANDTAVFS